MLVTFINKDQLIEMGIGELKNKKVNNFEFNIK